MAYGRRGRRGRRGGGRRVHVGVISQNAMLLPLHCKSTEPIKMADSSNFYKTISFELD